MIVFIWEGKGNFKTAPQILLLVLDILDSLYFVIN
mgnify:CR=1 FL=1